MHFNIYQCFLATNYKALPRIRFQSSQVCGNFRLSRAMVRTSQLAARLLALRTRTKWKKVYCGQLLRIHKSNCHLLFSQAYQYLSVSHVRFLFPTKQSTPPLYQSIVMFLVSRRVTLYNKRVLAKCSFQRSCLMPYLKKKIKWLKSFCIIAGLGLIK